MISQKFKPKDPPNGQKSHQTKMMTLFPFNYSKIQPTPNHHLLKNNISNKNNIVKEYKSNLNLQQNKTKVPKVHDENQDCSNFIQGNQGKKKHYEIDDKQSQNDNKDNISLLFQTFQSNAFLKLQELSNYNSSSSLKLHSSFDFENHMKFKEKKEDKEEKDEKEQKSSNPYINMKKKIKKMNKNKLNEQINVQSCQNLVLNDSKYQISIQEQIPQPKVVSLYDEYMRIAYDDKDVIHNIEEYKSNTISHRIDNDADSDDEQVNTGIKKMHTFLLSVINENKVQERQIHSKKLYPPKIQFARIY